MFQIFDVRTDVDACNCTWGLYGHCKSLHGKLTLGENNPLLYRGLGPVLGLHLAFQSDTLPTELSPVSSVDGSPEKMCA